MTTPDINYHPGPDFDWHSQGKTESESSVQAPDSDHPLYVGEPEAS